MSERVPQTIGRTTRLRARSLPSREPSLERAQNDLDTTEMITIGQLNAELQYTIF